MNYYDDQALMEEIYDRLFRELGREPSQDEIDNELFRLEQYEPDYDAMIKDDG
jgi:hypothetical protein